MGCSVVLPGPPTGRGALRLVVLLEPGPAQALAFWRREDDVVGRAEEGALPTERAAPSEISYESLCEGPWGTGRPGCLGSFWEIEKPHGTFRNINIHASCSRMTSKATTSRWSGRALSLRHPEATCSLGTLIGTKMRGHGRSVGVSGAGKRVPPAPQTSTQRTGVSGAWPGFPGAGMGKEGVRATRRRRGCEQTCLASTLGSMDTGTGRGGTLGGRGRTLALRAWGEPARQPAFLPGARLCQHPPWEPGLQVSAAAHRGLPAAPGPHSSPLALTTCYRWKPTHPRP